MMMMMWKKQRFPMGLIFLSVIFVILGVILIGASKNMAPTATEAVNGFTYLAMKNKTVGLALIEPTMDGATMTLKTGLVFAVILGPIFFGHAVVMGMNSWYCMMPMKGMKGMKGKNMKMMD